MTMKDVPFFGNFLENLFIELPLKTYSTWTPKRLLSFPIAIWTSCKEVQYSELKLSQKSHEEIQRNVKKLAAKLDGATNKLLVI